MRAEHISPKQFGFTLVELIFVIAILGVVASIGSGFMVQTVDAYRTAEVHNKLIQRGRLVIEQMSRQLRTAVPNAVRVSASANCIEFLPIVGGTYYENSVADEDNGMSATSTVTTLPFYIRSGSAEHVIIAPFFSEEVYTNSSPAARVSVGALGAEPYTSVPLSGSHRFNRNSNSKRLYIADDPQRFCLDSGNLVEYSGYGLSTSVLNDSNPGGSSAIMAQNVSSSGAFVLSPGSEDRNTTVGIALVFSQGSKSIRLNHTVFIRNVP